MNHSPNDLHGDEDSEDSDYDLMEEDAPAGNPVFSGWLRIAKVYIKGIEEIHGAVDIEFDRHWVTLHPDGYLWHSEGNPASGDPGLLGRLDLNDLIECKFNERRPNEICLTQEGRDQKGRCHLLRPESEEHDGQRAERLPLMSTWLKQIKQTQANLQARL